MVVAAKPKLGEHGAGMSVGTKSACCAADRLHGSFIAGGRVDLPYPVMSIEKAS
jgi:hypothetical protein